MSEREVLAVLLETSDERIEHLELVDGLTHSDAVSVAMTEARARLGLLKSRL
jgi:hypothetical protein